ncbi:MAG: M48 family metalloprotease [bacterium]|nr:M48 family metalloprotease [bacterium]
MTTMDFFGHQQRARSASKWLVVLFIAAVIAIIALIYVVAIVTLNVSDVRGGFWQPGVLLAVTGGVLATVVIAMIYKTNQLSQGGGAVARMMGGRLVDPGTTDLQDRTLHNIVEEMAIASGIPVPEVYVLDNENGLNAFAAGWGTDDAAVAVTRGLLDKLDRDELQGVIAHEFSHVFHGDMRLNIRLMGVLFGIVCLTTIGRILLHTGGGNRKNGGGVVVFGLALIIIGWLGVLFARLIQAAVSRQREFLADASAVQYTRNPRGIGMALAKIGGLGAVVENAHADEASHMMFADGVQRFIGGAFATHPPIGDRVVRVLPSVAAALKKGEPMTAAVDAAAPPNTAKGFTGGGAAAPQTPPPLPTGSIGRNEFIQSVGDPQPQHVAAARELLAELPLDLVAAAHDRSRAGALVLALLMERDPTARDAQLEVLPDRDTAEIQAARMFVPSLEEVEQRALLPLVEMAIPALRTSSPAERDHLRRSARALAEADDELSPFEFALLKTLEKHVPSSTAVPPSRRSTRPSALTHHLDEVATVLSVLAHTGAEGDETAATEAFAQGVRELGVGNSLTLRPMAGCPITALEASLDGLASISPLGKRNLLAACAAAAAADGVISAAEADLLRALAEIWNCPIPLVAGE